MQLASVDAFLPSAITFAAAFPGVPLHLWECDHEGAFRQFPVRLEDRVLLAVAIWDPDAGAVRFFLHHVLPFGAIASVFFYNLLADSLVFLAREMFLIPLFHFYDDFFSVEPAATAAGAFEVFGELNSLLGCVIKLPKDHLPSPIGPILGLLVRLDVLPFEVSIDHERQEKLIAAIDSILAANHLRPARAGKLSGQGNFASAGLFGRIGRAPLRAVYQRQHEKGRRSFALTNSLRFALRWLRQVVLSAGPRLVFEPRSLSPRRRVTLYTDATGGGVLGAVCVPPPPFRPAWVRAVVPPELTSLLRPRLTQVGPYEALAIVLALSAFADRGLEDADILLFVDNTEAQSIAINGFASAEDTALIAGDIWDTDLEAAGSFLD